MTATRTTTAVVSELLCDPPAAITGPVASTLLRSLGLTPADRDFAATVVAGHVESLDAWADRVLGGTP